MRLTPYALTAAFTILVAAVAAPPTLPGVAATQQPVVVITAGKPLQIASANWRATIYDVAKYTDNRENVDPVTIYPAANVLVSLKLEYIGPPGKVPAPGVHLVDQSGKQYRQLGNIGADGLIDDFTVVQWLMTATYPKPESQKGNTRELVTDFAFGLYRFYVAGVPADATSMLLAVGDITPTPVELRKPGANGQIVPLAGGK